MVINSVSSRVRYYGLFLNEKNEPCYYEIAPSAGTPPAPCMFSPYNGKSLNQILIDYAREIGATIRWVQPGMALRDVSMLEVLADAKYVRVLP